MSATDLLPLVCVHGWSLNGRVFDALRAALPAGYPLQTLDLPGHGGSPWHGDQASLEAQTDWLLQRLPPRCRLLGWSLGGQLALQAALQADGQTHLDFRVVADMCDHLCQDMIQNIVK
jgi:pimeloyl-[acyl-carrier protein] methyl ester esterase